MNSVKFLIEHLWANVSQRCLKMHPEQTVKPIRDCFCKNIVLTQAIGEFQLYQKDKTLY